MSGDLGDFSMIELFRLEAEGQLATLTRHLLALENRAPDAAALEAMMRAAHSLKGAARIVGLDAAVRVAHALEDCFVAAQKGRLTLGASQTDLLLQGVDWLNQVARLAEAEVDAWTAAHEPRLAAFVTELAMLVDGPSSAPRSPPASAPVSPKPVSPVPGPATSSPAAAEPEDRVLRVTAEKLEHLLGLAGESLVESRRLEPFGRSLLRMKRGQQALARSLAKLAEHLGPEASEPARAALRDAQARAGEGLAQLDARLEEMERFDRAATRLSSRLYREARGVRLRPFADGVQPFGRMVRDLARQLGKEARLVVTGEQTQVDRDVLARLEAPLTHLLRNALDHGVETPEARAAAGKSPAGTLRLDARHRAGRLYLSVSDDGAGIPVERVRAAAVERGLTTARTAAGMSEAEVLEFLFLPGFSLRSAVTELSGRGVGLDVVASLLKALRGTVRVATEAGRGTTFELQLPVTLSVVRALVVEIAGELYALPLAGVARVLRVAREEVATTEGRAHFELGGARVGLVPARQVLELPEAGGGGEAWPVVVIGEGGELHGLVVDALRGERELVARPLDPRLGKIPDVAAAAVLEDGSPVLFLDVEDLRRSIERLAEGGRLGRWHREGSGGAERARRRRVLVVDDSLTVRELEKKLLLARGYEVAVAVDGMEGWNAAREGDFDLVVTDVDMPRLDGIELVRLLKADERLKSVPVMIVSYKDREEDRRRGLDAGADYYLTKGSFHDDRLLEAVLDLIGPAEAGSEETGATRAGEGAGGAGGGGGGNGGGREADGGGAGGAVGGARA